MRAHQQKVGFTVSFDVGRYYTNDSEDSSVDVDDVPDFNAQNDASLRDLLGAKADRMGTFIRMALW